MQVCFLLRKRFLSGETEIFSNPNDGCCTTQDLMCVFIPSLNWFFVNIKKVRKSLEYRWKECNDKDVA